MGFQIIQKALGKTGDEIAVNTAAQHRVDIDTGVAYLKFSHNSLLKDFTWPGRRQSAA